MTIMQTMRKTPLKTDTACGGELTLTLEEAQDGGLVVTSPMWPELIAQAQTVRCPKHL